MESRNNTYFYLSEKEKTIQKYGVKKNLYPCNSEQASLKPLKNKRILTLIFFEVEKMYMQLDGKRIMQVVTHLLMRLTGKLIISLKHKVELLKTLKGKNMLHLRWMFLKNIGREKKWLVSIHY